MITRLIGMLVVIQPREPESINALRSEQRSYIIYVRKSTKA